MKLIRILLPLVIGPIGSFASAANQVGIGAALETTPDQTIIIRKVYPDSPAEKAGLQPNDRITTVQKDGSAQPINVSGKKVEEVVALIRGPNKTPVILGVLKSSGEQRSVTVIRDDTGVKPMVK